MLALKLEMSRRLRPGYPEFGLDRLRERILMNISKHHEIRVVGVCGSIRPGSFTRMALMQALAGAAENGATTRLIDLRDYQLPFVTTTDGPEQQSTDVMRLRTEMKAADGIILATPEYHGSFSGVLKNTIDLMGFDEFEGKMVGLLGVSGGRMGASDALNTLRSVGRALHAWVLPQQVSIAEAWSLFDSEGHINDERLRHRLHDTGAQVARFARVHKTAKAEEFVELWQKAPENPGGDAR
jgi:FMN reductase